jgi:hypothetical protein
LVLYYTLVTLFAEEEKAGWELLPLEEHDDA